MQQIKKYAFFCLVSISALLAGIGCNNKEKNLSYGQLPQMAQLFITQNMSSDSISDIKQENCLYQVSFMNGTSITFNKEGAWQSIKNETDLFPIDIFSVVPNSIIRYLVDFYPNNPVYQLSKTKDGYQVILGVLPHTVLDFNHEGGFVKVY